MPTGKFILPGLIDAHCHISLHQGALPGVRYTSSAEFCSLWAAHAIGRVQRAGVTGIVVPGKWFTDMTVRKAVEVLVCKAEDKFLLTVPTRGDVGPREVDVLVSSLRTTRGDRWPSSGRVMVCAA
jgi:hypothetical protein